MKKTNKLAVIGLILFLSTANICLANNYSPKAIQMYNLGAIYQNQGKYELAVKQYNMALSVQPDMVDAKHNLTILYENLAIRSFQACDYFNAISYARKSLQIKPNNVEMCTMVGDSFVKLKKNDNAISAYKKVIAIDPKNISAMHSIAQIYVQEHQYANAAPFYHKILAIDPNDQIAQQNSQYVDRQLQESSLCSSLNDLNSAEKAPIAAYNLIKTSPGVPQDSIGKTKDILDLIWGDPTGKILINNLINSKISINLTTQGLLDANATQTKKQSTLNLYGCIPLFTINRSSNEVNIPYVYPESFYNQNVSPELRLHRLHAFVHEFCHSYRAIKFPQAQNSVEEELGASMIGTNVAYKVITGKYLTRAQTQTYSMQYLQSLLGDSHRTLPVYSGFNTNMQSRGLVMPYPEVYSDIVSMYKKLLSERKVTPAPGFAMYMR